MPSFTPDEISYHDRRAEEESRLAAAASPGMHLHSELARFHRVRSALISAACSGSEPKARPAIYRTDKES